MGLALEGLPGCIVSRGSVRYWRAGGGGVYFC